MGFRSTMAPCMVLLAVLLAVVPVQPRTLERREAGFIQAPAPLLGQLKDVNVTLYVVGTLGGRPLTVKNWNNTSTSKGLGRYLVQIDEVSKVKKLNTEAKFIRVVEKKPCIPCKPPGSTGFFLEYHILYPNATYAQTAAAALLNAGLKLRRAIDKSAWTLKIDVFVMKTALIR